MNGKNKQKQNKKEKNPNQKLGFLCFLVAYTVKGTLVVHMKQKHLGNNK